MLLALTLIPSIADDQYPEHEQHNAGAACVSLPTLPLSTHFWVHHTSHREGVCAAVVGLV